MRSLDSLIATIRSALPAMPLLEREPLSAHCSFRIGGPCAALVQPSTEEEILTLTTLLRQAGERPLLIGNGTNLLITDGYVNRIVLQTGAAFHAIQCSGTTLTALSGASLARAALTAANAGLAGLEFAHGIPGSLGGAVMMNAGAYGGEMKDVIASVRYLDADGRICETAEPEFAYRHSRFADTGELILGASVRLTEDDPEAIHARMIELWKKRSASQPLDRPSAGSTFKRPATGYAAAMIDGAGLKGLTVGGAQVSEKHAGFVINTGSASFCDVTALMAKITDAVQEKYGVTLEPEVRIL